MQNEGMQKGLGSLALLFNTKSGIHVESAPCTSPFGDGRQDLISPHGIATTLVEQILT